MKRVYEVWQNSDTIEGRGPMKLIGTYGTQALAEQVKAGLPTDMGGNSLAEIRPSWVIEHESELPKLRELKTVEAALEKLTVEESEALRRFYQGFTGSSRDPWPDEGRRMNYSRAEEDAYARRS